MVWTDRRSDVRSFDIGGASWSGDAFGRLRTSGTGNRLDLEFIYDKQPMLVDEITNNGTVTHNTNQRDLTLSISNATNGTYATMRSHPVPYTPGNSQLIEITAALDLAGIGSGTAEYFLRTKVSGTVAETVVAQSSWTDATSGVDWTKSHIFAIDFQSLKVGRIRFGMVRNGAAVQVGEITNDNVRNTGYWQLPSLPVYWRLYNDATYTYMEVGYGDENNAVGFRYKITANASATMSAICATVKSEGGYPLAEMPGFSFGFDDLVGTTTVSTTLVPLFSIRVQSSFNSLTNLGIALPKSFTIETDNPILVRVRSNTTLTGASWTNVDSNSIVEYDRSATAVSGGETVYSGYFASSGKNNATSLQGVLGRAVLWDRQSSETGILTLIARRTGATDAAVLSSLNWEEIR